MAIFLLLIVVFIQIVLLTTPFFVAKKFPAFPRSWLRRPFFIVTLVSLQVIYFQILEVAGYFTYLNELLIANYL